MELISASAFGFPCFGTRTRKVYAITWISTGNSVTRYCCSTVSTRYTAVAWEIETVVVVIACHSSGRILRQRSQPPIRILRGVYEPAGWWNQSLPDGGCTPRPIPRHRDVENHHHHGLRPCGFHAAEQVSLGVPSKPLANSNWA